MKTIALLPEDVRYYKANLHCHSTLSDGKLTPEEMKAAYQKRGYQVVAFTDHKVYHNHEDLNDENFIAIAAIETDINADCDFRSDYSRVKTYHMNWYDTNPWENTAEKAAMGNMEQRYRDVDYINNHAKRMRELGFLSCYNHPYWSLQDYRDYSVLKGFWAMEIYNHGCELDGLFGYNPQVYDEMLRTGQRLLCVSTDDNHNQKDFEDAGCDSFGGYVMIGAGEFTYEGIIKALQKGDFYSCVSQDGREDAPEIHRMTLVDNKLYVKCSPVDKIFVKTRGRNCYQAMAQPGETLSEAVFTLTGQEGYIRLDICDSHGRRANSNAYFMDDILGKQWEK